MSSLAAAVAPQQPLEVDIGQNKLGLAKSNLVQEEQFLAVLAKLELERFIGPLAAVLEAYAAEGGLKVGQFGRLLRDVGPDLIAGAKPVIGRQLAPIAAEATAILLDTRANRKLLIAAQVMTEDDAVVETDEDGVYIRCRRLRGWIRENADLNQALVVIKAAYGVNGYGELLGKLGGLLAEAKPQTSATEAPQIH